MRVFKCLPFAVLLLLGLVSLNHAEEESSSDDLRVLNGFEMDTLTYQVSLRKNNKHFCGGVIASQRFILSAAHCTVGFKAADVVAVAGSLRLNSGGDKYPIEKIIAHEWYNHEVTGNDIALFKTAMPMAFDRGYGPIPLCADFTPPNTMMLLVGWGLTSYPSNHPSNTLMGLKKMSIAGEVCQEIYKDTGYQVSQSTNLCTEGIAGRGSCVGDSGGALIEVEKHCLAGLVSWGIPCGRGMPDIYTRITAYSFWIEKNIKSN